MALSSWAVSQISRLLPLDEEPLRQIIDYSSTLSKDQAAEHLKNLLGDSPQALEFISSFNARRESPKANLPRSNDSDTVRKPHKKRAPLNKLPPSRRPDDYGNTAGGYLKKDEGDYISGSSRTRREPHLANTLALSDKPDALQLPTVTSTSAVSSRNASPKPPPSAAGSLISDLPNVKTSRTSSPAPKTKISVAGGTSMHGNSSTINDLDSAIRALEIQTNPSLTPSETDSTKRRCNCNATRHPLLAAAPNCLNCGKVICVKEGIGPCTFCGRSILSANDIQGMVRALREERGREKMDANNASYKRPDVSKTPRPFATPTSTPATSESDDDARKLTAAKQHRDKLLNYQAQNARRTRVIDEAADFETPAVGQNMWSSPAERALQLKRQQKVLREQEWNARPEYEKRKVVLSVDLVGGKVVRKMANVKREDVDEQGSEGEEENEGVRLDVGGSEEGSKSRSQGAFSRNPLLGGLIRPLWKRADDEGDDAKGKGKGKGTNEAEISRRDRNPWRRVQDDNDDNEGWILDGGIYGNRPEGERFLGAEEHAQG